MTSIDRVRRFLVERLRDRHAELVAAILTRVREEVPDPERDQDPEFVEGLRKTVEGSIDYMLDTIERGRVATGEPPYSALAQARRAVHHGQELRVVVSRYTVGYAAAWDLILEEADKANISEEDHSNLLRQSSIMQAALSEMLVASIGEYTEETRRVARGRGERRTEQVEKALSGQPVDPAVLGYDLATTHIGVIAKSENADDLLADIASRLELQLLSLSRSEDTVWAWLGNKGGFAEHGVHDLLSREAAGGDIIGVGEPADGPGGFRQTHRQAQSSYQLALRLESATMKQSVTRYKDVALLALALQDDAVAESLVDLYIGPLSDARDRGKALKDTLRAYFATGQNAASAAAKLGVHERTVSYRLRAIEEHLGHAVNERRAELEVALKLEELLA